MKRLILLLTAFIAITASAQQQVGYDEVELDISSMTGTDTILYPNMQQLYNCQGNLVIIRVTVKNTNAIIDSLIVGGRDGDVAYDNGGKHFEPINHSSLPFIIDTTNTGLTEPSFSYNSDGEYYSVSFSRSGFLYKVPAVKITKAALTQGDVMVYFHNMQSTGEGTLDADALTSNDTVITSSLSYDATTGGDEVIRLNPEWAHRTTTTEAISQTNLDTDSVYYAFSMDTYNHALVYWFLSGGATLTVYVSPDEDADATDETTGDWIDAGTDLLGGASVSDENDYFVIDTPTQFEKVLIKVETSDATNSISVWEKRFR